MAGELNPDAILVGESIEPEYGQVERLVDDGALTVGSSGAIVACGAARLGMRTAYVGVVGDDAAGRFMLDELRGRGVDVDRCRVDPGRRDGPERRAQQRRRPRDPHIRGRDVEPDRRRRRRRRARRRASTCTSPRPTCRPGLRDGLAELFARARAAGTTTSLDPGWDPGSAADGLDDVLAATDVFLPNAAEACRLTGAGDPDAAIADLAARVPTVVVTLGADGAIARRGDEATRAEAPAVDSVDTTGAGDNLAAGLLCGLGRGMALAEALRLGVACGSRSTSALGGVDGQPDLGEALELAGLAEGALR